VKSDAGGFGLILPPAITEGEKFPGTPSDSLSDSTMWNGAAETTARQCGSGSAGARSPGQPLDGGRITGASEGGNSNAFEDHR